MIIRDIETVVVGAPTPGDGRLSNRNYIFVLVHTSEGVTGLGEATLEGHDRSILGAIEDLKSLIIGEDVSRIGYVTQKLRRQKFWGGGVIKGSAIAGIELALWDIAGKRAGLPVHALVGGAVRDRIRVYANGWTGGATDTARIRDGAQRALERGYHAFKFSTAVASEPVRDVEITRLIVSMAETIRDAIGEDSALMFDGHGRYDRHLAMQIARALEDVGLLFFEEPVQPHRVHDMAAVAAAAPMPIAAGERLTTKEEVLPYLTSSALAVIQPDLAHCHGFSEARDIATLADAFGSWAAPHAPMSPVVAMASLHLDAVLPNFLIQERLLLDDWRDHIIDPPLVVTDGYIDVPSRPGWGIELNLELCRSKPEIIVEMPQLIRTDGSIADW